MAMLDSEEFKKYMQHEWEECRNRMRMLTFSMFAILAAVVTLFLRTCID